jgi:hypothetical protein
MIHHHLTRQQNHFADILLGFAITPLIWSILCFAILIKLVRNPSEMEFLVPCLMGNLTTSILEIFRCDDNTLQEMNSRSLSILLIMSERLVLVSLSDHK